MAEKTTISFIDMLVNDQVAKKVFNELEEWISAKLIAGVSPSESLNSHCHEQIIDGGEARQGIFRIIQSSLVKILQNDDEIENLSNLLDKHQSPEQYYACIILGWFGNRAIRAVERLLACFCESHRSHLVAGIAIKRIGGSEELVLTLLEKSITDGVDGCFLQLLDLALMIECHNKPELEKVILKTIQIGSEALKDELAFHLLVVVSKETQPYFRTAINFLRQEKSPIIQQTIKWCLEHPDGTP